MNSRCVRRTNLKTRISISSSGTSGAWADLERGGAGRGLYYSLRPALHNRIAAEGHPERNRRIDWEAAKTRILRVLKHRAERGEKGLTNSEIRGITHFDSRQVKRLMAELKADGQLQVAGKTSGAVWIYVRP